ncbi:Uncharacterised protein [Streptococcus pneumoniae]|nr:Uncharacterised protein [Streptococcus pneumoniae]CAG5362513.1 Uncharacterised protein [Streptococcus pneumoniae]
MDETVQDVLATTLLDNLCYFRINFLKVIADIFHGKNQLLKQALHGKLMIRILQENTNRLDTFDDRKLTDLAPIYQDLTAIGKRTNLGNDLKKAGFS